ncbi:MAG: aminotransferase class V-fold PLP-dependent enzyme, partial [Clostridiales bacterium]|nr:aminotransferase class V-fold PLP-dependent enzyme [Clostridiales bacterium]
MNRVYNFSAGPSVLPEDVLKKAQEEMLVYGDSGMSVMEMSHRSKAFESIIQSAEESLRRVMGIPENYKVLFLQGGASSQFAMIPLNLMKKGKIDLVLTGMWSKKARAEAEKYGKVNVVASSEDKNFNYIPELDSSKFDPDAD